MDNRAGFDMDKLSLESAIRNETEEAIRAIGEKEAAEIKKLNDEYAAEVDDFRNRAMSQTDALISQESSRVENRANLDLKKHKLRSAEAFISRTVEAAMKTIREHPDYKNFFTVALGDAAARIPAKAEVRLMRDDLVFAGEIREELKDTTKGSDIILVEDRTIRWGGCIIVDDSGGRIFDNTIERSYFRKAPVIRREVMKFLSNISFRNRHVRRRDG